MSQGLDYVRRYYGLDVKRGERVKVFGRLGRVTSGDAQYVRVRVDGERVSWHYHPYDVEKLG